MKKITSMAAFCALVMSLAFTQASAQDSGSNYSDCCEWSLCDGKLLLGAEWLYWQIQQDNMSYVSRQDLNVANSNAFIYEVVEPSFDFTSGFRVNIGYELPADTWEMSVVYTYVPSKSGKKREAATDDFAIIPQGNSPLIANLINNPIENPTIEFFEQNWDLAVNNIDFDFARTIHFNDSISIRPHAGFRSMWYTEKQRLYAQVEEDIYNDFSFSVAKGKNKFTGYGIEAGIWGSWMLGCNISVIGHLGGSVMFSKFTVTNQIIETLLVSGQEPTIVEFTDNTDHIKTATPTADVFLGLQYADTLCDLECSVRLGWEQRVLFNTNRIFGNGNLSMQGLVLGFELGF